jgi:hypothetical protein
MSRVTAGGSAFGDRSAPFLIGIEANWESPSDDDANIAWGREVFGVLEPFSTGAEYVNFPGLYEDSEQMVLDAFGGNLNRLRGVKRQYDPTNLFRLNHNITRPDTWPFPGFTDTFPEATLVVGKDVRVPAPHLAELARRCCPLSRLSVVCDRVGDGLVERRARQRRARVVRGVGGAKPVLGAAVGGNARRAGLQSLVGHTEMA